MAWLKYRGTPARGSYYAIWTERVGRKRKQRWRSLRTRDTAVAGQALREIGRNLTLDGVGLGQVVPLAQLRDKYVKHLRAALAAPEYVARVEIVLTHLERLYPAIKVPQLTAELLDEYKLKRRAEGIAATTLKREVAAIKTVVRTGRRWHFRTADLSDVTKMKVQTPAKVPYGRDAVKALFERARADEDRLMYTVLLLGLYAGLRRSEILALRWRDVDFEAGRLLVGVGWRAKGGKARAVALNVHLGEHLAAIRGAAGPEDRMVPWPHTPQALTGRFVAFRARVGLPAGSLHTLRHTFVTELKKLDVDTGKTMRLTGHTTERTTQGYTHLEVGDLKESVDRLDFEGSKTN
jgi:integrase/recombinase XerC